MPHGSSRKRKRKHRRKRSEAWTGRVIIRLQDGTKRQIESAPYSDVTLAEEWIRQQATRDNYIKRVGTFATVARATQTLYHWDTEALK